MDRLICGDVGNGQTELAPRVAFKVVEPEAHIEVILPFRDSCKTQQLAIRSKGHLKVLDGTRFFCRLKKGQTAPSKLYDLLRFLLKP